MIKSLAVCLLFAAATLFVAFPLAALVLKTTPTDFIESLHSPQVLDALKLSLATSLVSTMIVVIAGTPVSYVNARHDYPGKDVIDTLLDLPAILPPLVAGLALLMAYGRRGLLGQYLDVLGINIAFTSLAVITAQVFVSAPYYIRQARASFEDVDVAYEKAASTLGASKWRTFFKVTMPMAAGGLVSGALMCWSRALSEFGATIMFAGNYQGRTQTMPLAIYVSAESDMNAALTLAVILVALSFTSMMLVKKITKKRKNAVHIGPKTSKGL
ncbi:MAG: ABC transporter permease [Candidatus Altiarchaeia archaeon]